MKNAPRGFVCLLFFVGFLFGCFFVVVGLLVSLLLLFLLLLLFGVVVVDLNKIYFIYNNRTVGLCNTQNYLVLFCMECIC